jgi:hypothetical protein
MIGERFNFEDVFFRDLTVCVLDTLEGQVRWVNRFTSGDVSVTVPFYYSLTGDERFLLDSFADDIVSENRFVELNTDQIPRGHLTMTGFNIRSDEFANPNVWLRMVVENEVEIRKVLARVRCVPITVNYDLTILLTSEVDTFKCSQAIMDTLWMYKYMYFEYNFMNIDAVILMPDTNTIQVGREKNLTSDNNITLKATFEVHTYYPAMRKDRINMEGYPRSYGDGSTFEEVTGDPPVFYPLEQWPGPTRPGLPTDPLPPLQPPPFPPIPERDPPFPPDPPTPPIFPSIFPVNFPGTSETSGTPGTPKKGQNPSLFNDPDYFMLAPKRTRWFNNILAAREKNAKLNNLNANSNPSPPRGGSNPPTNPNPPQGR